MPAAGDVDSSTRAALPAAVLFDMDGLLVDTESTWHEAERTVVAELGGSWGARDAELMVGGPLERAVAYMIEISGGHHDPAAVMDRLLTLMETLLRAEPIHWRPGARELLAALRARQVPCALVSASWRTLVDAVLEAILHDACDRRFDTTVAGDELERTKPHPDPYLEAARRLGADPLACVVLEDSPTGVAAGAAAGALVVAVPTAVEIEERAGVRVLDSLTLLTPALLGQWSYDWQRAATGPGARP